jgi:hypothetical protein
MIASTTIIVTETKTEVRREYQLGEGDVYYISRRWISNCSLPMPKKFSVFVFGGRQLFVTSDCMRNAIKAVPVKGSWRLLYLRYWLRETFARIKRRFQS